MGHGHHHHEHAAVTVSAATRRKLVVAIAPFVLATILGLFLLWPADTKLDIPQAAGPVEERYSAEVIGVERDPCDLPGQEGFDCAIVEVEIADGPDAGETASMNVAEGPNARHVAVGDDVLVGKASQAEPGQEYYFSDFKRGSSILILVGLFAIVVIALSRWRGLSSMVGLAVSLVLLVYFVLPAILEGSSPVMVAIVGGSAIMFVTLYLAHGFNAMTTTAVLGTLASLVVTGALALYFVEAFKFSGFGSEEAVFLQVAAQQINLQGLLLGSIIIGTLGVMDDVTVTQASAVWELHRANPTLGSLGLYRAAVRIGRDHIASTVNTLVLAYAGASLPLLILFTLAERPFGQVITSEVVAEEVVRTLVGSIGLIASVPITTALAALVAAGDSGPRLLGRGPRPPVEREGFKRPRAEDFFRPDDPVADHPDEPGERQPPEDTDARE